VRSEPLLAALLLAAAVVPGRRIDTLSVAHRLAPVPATVLPADRMASWFSGRRMAADFIWIDLLQYCADAQFILDRGAKLSGLARRATVLDPGFAQVYMYAGSALMWQCDRPGEAAALLEQGIAANPGNNRLQYYLAAFTYRRLKDIHGEVAVLERLAFAPDAPIILRRILANAYERDRDLDRAAAIWRLIHAQGEDPAERRWADGKLARYGLTP